MTTLRKLLTDQGFEYTFKAIMKHSEPKTEDQAHEMIAALLDGLCITVAWECNRHIEEHDGYDCARGIIEAIGDKLKHDAKRDLNLLLKVLERPLLDSHNQQVAEQILKEIEHDK